MQHAPPPVACLQPTEGNQRTSAIGRQWRQRATLGCAGPNVAPCIVPGIAQSQRSQARFVGEDLRRPAVRHDAALTHQQHAVGQLGQSLQPVLDNHHSQPFLALQPRQGG